MEKINLSISNMKSDKLSLKNTLNLSQHLIHTHQSLKVIKKQITYAISLKYHLLA